MRALATLILALPLMSAAADIREHPPQQPEQDHEYVFYLHGRIVETDGRRPTSPQFGLYDYPAVLEALAANGATVISRQRPKDTDYRAYGEQVAREIRALIAAGASASQITVVGFSKGGAIALEISTRLALPGLRYVILAGCGDWLSEAPDLRLTGRVLSIVERSDTIAGSCRPLLERNPRPATFQELEIETGKGHGAFFLPRAVWVEPTLAWIAGRNS